MRRLNGGGVHNVGRFRLRSKSGSRMEYVQLLGHYLATLLTAGADRRMLSKTQCLLGANSCGESGGLV
jgi:hypothetical protein